MKKSCGEKVFVKRKTNWCLVSESRQNFLEFWWKNNWQVCQNCFSKCREVQHDGTWNLKEWECFVERNANQKKWTWDKKLIAWLSELLPFDLGYSLGNGNFVFREILNFAQFRCFVELKFGEFVGKLFFRPEEVIEDKNLSRRREEFLYSCSDSERELIGLLLKYSLRRWGETRLLWGCKTVFWVSRVTMNAN